jgi:hypothetical protein
MMSDTQAAAYDMALRDSDHFGALRLQGVRREAGAHAKPWEPMRMHIDLARADQRSNGAHRAGKSFVKGPEL